MVLKEDILQKRIDELSNYIFREKQSLFPLKKYSEPHSNGKVHTAIPTVLTQSNEYAECGELFCGLDDYLWLEKEIQIPPAAEGFEIYGFFDFGKTGGGGNSGFESLLYINGKPYQGVDTNHREVNLNEFAGATVTLTFMLWTGLRGGPSVEPFMHILKKAEIGYVHTDTLTLYYRLRAILQSVQQLTDTYQKLQLLECAQIAIQQIKWETELFNESVNRALKETESWFEAHKKINPVTVRCVGQTHIDIAWLWRLCHTREKAIRSFSTVMRLFNEFPEFLFFQSQPQLYSFIKEDCPELYEQIKKQVKNGRWEADGAMWLEADCNISGGEALARQLIHGIRFMKEEFGVECSHLWLPDVFGYSWALPQLLKQAHIKTFMTTKISWNETNQFPNHLFTWRGIDGSEILSYFITTPDIDFPDPINEPRTRYNGMMDAVSVIGTWDKFRQKDISDEVLIAYGHGDGGGGVTRDMLRMRREFDKNPFMPSLKPQFAGEFFETIHKKAEANPDRLPIWDGELYLEYHRGTYTTQANNKKFNRLSESRLFLAEWLNALNVMQNGEDSQAKLNKLWKTVLLNQFHDIIPGSSIHEVYEDSRSQYMKLLSELDDNIKSVCRNIIFPKKDGYTVINPSPFRNDGYVLIPETRNGYFTDNCNMPLRSQRTSDGYKVNISSNAMSLTKINFVETDKTTDCDNLYTVSDDISRITTPYYSVKIERSGRFSELFDLESKRNVLESGKEGNIFCLFEDRPTSFDAWNIDENYSESYRIIDATDMQVIESGSEHLKLRITYKEKYFSVKQDIIFFAHNKRIDFSTYIDWHESHHLLKVFFPINVRSISASYDIQYGYTTRPTHRNTSWERAKFETVAHKWVDISDTGYGVALLNDCKYGHNVYNSTISLSLLRSPKAPDEKADMGEHEFTYSLLPHNGDLAHSDVITQANSLNHPLFALSGHFKGLATPLSCSDDGIQIDALKTADYNEGFIIRIHEAKGKETHFTLKTPLTFKEWCMCDLLEVPCGEMHNEGVIEDTLSPFEIRTYRLK